ncbi:MAG TPA: hypothetical protein VG692_03810, partial [Gemmatimonadales bacterium]|nr:hypothetical protein [Gemmatimonadales bacterium]
MRSWQFPVLAVVAAGVVAACGSGSKPTDPLPAVGLQLAVAPPATFAARSVFTPAPEVQLIDANSDAVAQGGVSITAVLSGGAGALQGVVSATTDASGKATFSNLSISGGVGTKLITFTAAGLNSVTTTALTMTAGPAASVTAASTTAQTALTSSAVPVLPSVTVTDQDQNPVQGVDVTFAITAGGGQVTGATQTTNAQGVATVGGWTTGAATGVNTMTATAPALTPVAFNVTAAPAGVAAKLAIQTAPPATVAARATLAATVIQLQDAVGTPVNTAGIGVTVALNGGGTLGGTTTVNTDAAGQASFADLSIAATVGTKTLAFSSAGLVGVTSGNIALTAGSASAIAANSATTQAGITGGQPAALPSVKVTDLDGNAVAGVAVLFTLTGGGGS